MYSLDGNFIKEFDSITDAEKETDVLGVNISACAGVLLFVLVSNV
jgi:hypothetical protein